MAALQRVCHPLDGDESHSVRGDVPAGGDVAQGRGDARLAWVMAATQRCRVMTINLGEADTTCVKRTQPHKVTNLPQGHTTNKKHGRTK